MLPLNRLYRWAAKRIVQDSPPRPIDGGARISCAVQPKDFAMVQASQSEKIGATVALGIYEQETRVVQSVVLTPYGARAFAAAILDAADACDGTTPLTFHPPSPEASER